MSSEGYQKVAVHALIKNEKDEYLVTRRSLKNDWQPNVWDLPGGSIEFGEDTEDALHREVDEETGIKVKIIKLMFCHTFMSNPQRQQFQLVYRCEYLNGEVRLNPGEHDEFRWLKPEEFKDLKKIAFFESLCNQLFF